MIGLGQARSGFRLGPLATPAWTTALSERTVLVVSMLLLLAQELVFGVYTVDDAFISFRYARNLASGLGLVFNPGERVEGYTNFLWTVLMSGGYWLGFDLVIFAKLVGIAASLGIVYLLCKLGTLIRPSSAPAGSRTLAGLLLAANGAFATAAITGLETSLFTLLITAGAYFYLRQSVSLEVRAVPWRSCNRTCAGDRRGFGSRGGLVRQQASLEKRYSQHHSDKAGRLSVHAGDLSAICFALSAMTRPEGVVVFAFGLLFLLVSHRFRLSALTTCARWLGIFAAIFLPYYLWRFSYYGYPFPNTYYAKTGAGLGQYVKGLLDLGLFSSTYYAFLFPPALLVLMRRGAPVVTRFLSVIGVLYLVIIFLGTLSPTYLAFLFVVALLILIRYTGAGRLMYPAGLILLYVGINVYEGGDWIPFFRMLVPVLPLYCLVLQEAAVRAWSLAEARLSRERGHPDRRRVEGAAFSSGRLSWARPSMVYQTVRQTNLSDIRPWIGWGLVIALVLAMLWPSVGMWGKLRNDAIGYAQAHQTLGRWMAVNARGPIALMDIGLIGYISNLAIIDISGLTDLHVAHAPGGLIDKKFDLAYVLERDPEYFVLTSTTDFVAVGGKPTDFPIDRRIYEDERFTGSYRHLFTLDEGWRERGRGYFLAVFGRR
ncbi:MAG: hypothetical protein EPO21_07425 [Chloroflexota bacterium]|nr:MAG: hypothetical protein EPO21_07425 [Chloroflexota bacterium]